MSIHAILTATSLWVLPPAPAVPAQETATQPPGLVAIQGVRAKIGTEVKEIEKLIAAGNEGLANVLASETPQHTVQVDDFLLQVTEVTNEQYAAYVSAAGVRPPYTWGGAAIEKARLAWFEEEKRKKDEAAAAGKVYRSTDKFDAAAAEAWWEDHWQESEWAVPTEIANHPVTYVDFADAQGYARWAGLRLMSEFEFQAAARGTATTPYPWGDAWDPKQAAGLASGRVKTWPVGSFPATNGVHDLIGNVWEWTSSPFSAYPGYKPIKVKVGRGREVEGLAAFDPDLRVAVGGDFHADAVALRVSVRRNTARSQRTDALGFRCAATPKPGRDLAQTVATTVVSPRAFPDAEFAIELPIVLHRWTYEVPEGGELKDAAKTKDAARDAAPPARPEGYAVITAYDAMLFVPAQELPAVNVQTLDGATADAPLPIGIFYTSVPTQKPELQPGGYYIAYRGPGKLKELEEGEEAPAWRTAEGFDPEVGTLFFLDGSGAPLLTVAGGPAGYEKLSGAGTVALEPWTPPAKVDEDAPPPTPFDVVRFRVGVQGTQNNRGFTFDLPFQLAPGTVDGTWGSK